MAVPQLDLAEPQTSPHARAIAAELAWLGEVIEARLKHFFAGQGTPLRLPPAPAPITGSALGALIEAGSLTTEARLVLALAVAAHVNSAILDPFFVRNKAIDRIFSQFGGIHVETGAFQPTAETALFLLAGAETTARITAMAVFDPDHPLRRRAGVMLGAVGTAGPTYGAVLTIPVHRVVALCEGGAPKPDFAPNFPAQRLTTGLGWNDLVLPPDIQNSLGHIVAWLENRERILGDWGLARHLGHGFKALFYGPPGTGKTLTASLLGKRTGLDVYRIDLSMIVSKYIGETEKNLGLVFDMAAEREWILFFDEADALFGARTATTNAHDRYANQEVSYLLQRIEECRSLVILATNLRSNIDDAFFRRFQMAIGFTRPDAAQRERIWRGLMAQVPLAEDVDMTELARSHDLVGGAIINVARHAAITAMRRGAASIGVDDLRQAIASEMRKEGRTS
ncbi:ATP-binding protein [Rhodovulum steppense]|uniref:ATPase family protein associated with various cellular activities (AAA) n=1 Tax=Rhodovulum steppense TaxID=540251 RepID=A0A4R1YYF6_9RHOB|nr:ATP-binding protein [Rhodovulum steppense]TCM86117.1 ATPase family protein associated with various cellular activities (AAA) [Rhodovulum steppense]